MWAGLGALEKERKFKFTLQDTENIGIKEESSGELKSEGWQIIKDKWQGMGETEWKKMRAGRNKYIYKTFIKEGGTMMAKSRENEKKVKGLLGLGRFEWGDEKTTMEEEKGVCAVIGKDSKGTGLLVMMVKGLDSDKQKELWLGSNSSTTGAGNGCEKIATHKNRFEKEIEVVRKGFVSGFGSTVLKEGVVQHFEKEMKGIYEMVFEGVVKEGIQSAEQANNIVIKLGPKKEAVWMEYGSVGIISGIEGATVLDIIKFEEKIENTKKEWIRHRPFDIKKINMNSVVLVNLEDLVISEESIGDGKKNEIKWGNIPKPTLVSELLK